MIVTTYTCDKCGHAQTTKDQMWHVGITIWHVGNPPSGSRDREQLWCRDCIERAHMLKCSPEKQATLPPPPPPTFEDLIREIAREEIDDARP